MAGSGDPVPGRGAAPIEAVLFDAGDTLIYMPRSADEILRDLCCQFGITVSTDDAIAACRESERYYAENYLSHTGDQGAFWRRYHGAALSYLRIDDPLGERASLLSHGFGLPEIWRPFPEAEGVCGRLRAMGLKLGVVSNGPVTVADLLADAGLLPFFDAVISSQAVGMEKPESGIYLACLEILGVPPARALFVGDLYEVDVLGARSAGLEAALVIRDAATPVQGGCRVLRSLTDVIPLVEERGYRGR